MPQTTLEILLSVPPDRIDAPGNVRELDGEHVDALAASIQLQGILAPLLVTPTTGDPAHDYRLIAGFHRHAAALKLKLGDVPVLVQHADHGTLPQTVAASRAVENIVRQNLDPRAEALAVKAMLDAGMTRKGVAQTLAWAPQRVAARMKLLELPERAQQLIGNGTLPVSNVDTLRQIGECSPRLLDATIRLIAEDPSNAHAVRDRTDRLLIEAAARTDGVFAEQLTNLNSWTIRRMGLPDATLADYDLLLEERKKLAGGYYTDPTVRFTDAEIDKARAAHVLIETSRSPVITSQQMYMQLIADAITRSIQDTRQQIKNQSAKRGAERDRARIKRAEDPSAQLERQHRATIRGLATQAHGANTDLGWALRNNLSVVDPADMTVARFFCLALLSHGPSWRDGADNDSDRVEQLAASGVRLVIDEFRKDVTKTRKDGSRGALKIVYDTPDTAREWLWHFIDGATTAGELYGRTLVVIASEHYASRLALPQSQQQAPLEWRSRQNQAIQALQKLAGPHLPATLTALNAAVKQAEADRKAAQRKLLHRLAQHRAATASNNALDTENPDDPGDDIDGQDRDGWDVDTDLDELDD